MIGQDVALLDRRVNGISPMVYHRLRGQSPEWVVGVVEDAHMRNWADVLPIIETVDTPGTPLAAELRHAPKIARASSDQRVLLFDLRVVARDPGKLAVVRTMFRVESGRWQVKRE